MSRSKRKTTPAPQPMTPTRLAAALRLAGYVRENKIFVTKTVAIALADALLYLYEQAETGRSVG